MLSQGFDDVTAEGVAADLDRYAHPEHLPEAMIEEWIAAFGMLPSRASYGAIAAIITRAQGRAHELASRYLDPEVQDAIDPAAFLAQRAKDESFRPAGLAGALPITSPVPTTPAPTAVAVPAAAPPPELAPAPKANSRFLVHSTRRFSSTLKLKSAGQPRWKPAHTNVCETSL